MAAITPRRSQRLPHSNTPKMSERKKGLFQMVVEASKESLTEHRRLPVVDSESDGEEVDLGIGTLDSSSCDENDSNPKTPERTPWHATRSQSKKLLKERQELKNFMKSPFTLTKYQTRYSGGDVKNMGSLSTPATPQFHNQPVTPSSTHSCGSIHTTSSSTSKARKSLASLIADTESCSSSLKDLNFDSDSSMGSKENTPTKNTPTKSSRSSRKDKRTPKFHSFKGILVEQKKNIASTFGISPMKSAVVCLTKMDMSTLISPTQMLKTPRTTTDTNMSPPKLRKSVIEIDESPETTCDSEKSYKRFRTNSQTDAPASKHPRLEMSAPKARLSLFNSDRLKEILSAKSFYGKPNPEINSNVAAKLSNAIEVTSSQHRKTLTQSYANKRKKRPGQINMGVRHRIRKPRLTKTQILNMKTKAFMKKQAEAQLNNSTMSSAKNNNSSMASQLNSSQEIDDKIDLFDKENQTIANLLSQWTEDEEPELSLPKHSNVQVPCFNANIIEETNQIFQPVTAVAVPLPSSLPLSQDSSKVIVELGSKKPNDTNMTDNLPQSVTAPTQNMEQQDVVMMEGHASDHGALPKSGQFLPVEGGYILVEENSVQQEQEVLPDLDEIEREMRMLDEQILQMAASNNINAAAVLASTETDNSTDATSSPTPVDTSNKEDKPEKLFPIFSNPNPGVSTTAAKGAGDKSKKSILKSGADQYVIDAGQKVFGATQCNQCGVIYQVGDPQDEHDHLVYHNAADVLKFNGWKEETVVGRVGQARVLLVRGAAAGWRRVRAVLARLVHPQLGYTGELPGPEHTYTAYLYIEKKQIIGCLIMEPKVRAYKMLPGDPDCCSVEDYPVKCGVCRVWTLARERRRGVAATLLDCARASLLAGSALTVADVAFSAPTPAGKAFATRYTGTPNFYVYLD